MRALVLLLVFAATVAVVAVFVLTGGTPAGPSVAVAAPQHVTMTVKAHGDQMAGQYLLARPGVIVLTIVNYARHAHVFSVPGLGIDRVVLPGSPTHPSITVVRFTTPAGTFYWYCKLPCSHAMSGDLYVSPSPPRIHGDLWATA